MSTSAVTPDPYASIAVPLPSQGDPYMAIAMPLNQPDTRSLLQKAKDNFQRNFDAASADVTPEERKRIGPVAADIKQALHTAGGIAGGPIAHPLNFLSGLVDTGKEVLQMATTPFGQTQSVVPSLNKGAHPLQDTASSIANDYETMPVDQAIAKSVGTVGGMYLGGKVAKGATSAAAKVPSAVGRAAARVVAGDKLDTPITGDSVTPRELYNTAKQMGVSLDTAQATGSSVSRGAKMVTEHSFGGSSPFEANKQANIQALQAHAQNLLDTASPIDMSREDFGNKVKARLQLDQQNLNDTSGDLYKKLDADLGASIPDSTAVRDVAQKIVDQNKGYYAAHPDLLGGGAGKAWRIVNNLAESGEAAAPKTVTSPILDSTGAKITTEVPGAAAHQDTWSDLHKLRSDLLDITRGPEMIGDRPTGWIKQLTGAVDDTMTKAADGDSVGDFRDANEIYKYMKQTYDDPTSALYHVVRSPDGLTAANTLANITPAVARKIGTAAPELVPQLQRQTIARILSPAGNDVPDLQNLPSRLSRVQKEQLHGVLTPEQVGQLEDLGRVSRAVNYDSNTSGSAKVGQKVVEAGVIGSGLMRAGLGLISGDPAAVAEGAAPIAYAGAQRGVAKAITSPKVTDAVMKAAKPSFQNQVVVPVDATRGASEVALPVVQGQDKWAQDGAQKLKAHLSKDDASGLSATDIDQLAATPKGKSLLMRASSLAPGSPMMNSLLQQIKALQK
jgi:hypothetical protein